MIDRKIMYGEVYMLTVDLTVIKGVVTGHDVSNKQFRVELPYGNGVYHRSADALFPTEKLALAWRVTKVLKLSNKLVHLGDDDTIKLAQTTWPERMI